MEFKSTVNEVDHKKYNVLVYCKGKDEKDSQIMVELDYTKWKETVIIQPVGEQYIALTPKIYDEILENVKNALVAYLYKRLRDITQVFYLKQDEYILIREENFIAESLMEHINEIKSYAIKRRVFSVNIEFASQTISGYIEAWALSDVIPYKEIQINYPITLKGEAYITKDDDDK